MMNLLSRLHHDESGQDLIEYALIAALIALGAVATLGPLGKEINNAFGQIDNTLQAQIPAS
jgi:pilus assembly protein Flp/PilA